MSISVIEKADALARRMEMLTHQLQDPAKAQTLLTVFFGVVADIKTYRDVLASGQRSLVEARERLVADGDLHQQRVQDTREELRRERASTDKERALLAQSREELRHERASIDEQRALLEKNREIDKLTTCVHDLKVSVTKLATESIESRKTTSVAMTAFDGQRSHFEKAEKHLEEQIRNNKRLGESLTEKQRAFQEAKQDLESRLERAQQDKSALLVEQRTLQTRLQQLTGELADSASALKQESADLCKSRQIVCELTKQLHESQLTSEAEQKRLHEELSAENEARIETASREMLTKSRDFARQLKAAQSRVASLEIERDSIMEQFDTSGEAELEASKSQLLASKEDLQKSEKRNEELLAELKTAQDMLDGDHKRRKVRDEGDSEHSNSHWDCQVARVCRKLLNLHPRESEDSDLNDGWGSLDFFLFHVAGALSKQCWAENLEEFLDHAPEGEWFCLEGTYRKGFRDERASPDENGCIWHPTRRCCEVSIADSNQYGLLNTRTIVYSEQDRA